MSTGQARPFESAETHRLSKHSDHKNPLRWREGKEYFHNEGLYQAFTYAAALDAPAVLVYPRVDWDVDVTLDVAGSVVKIETASLQAGVPLILKLRQGRGDLRNQLDYTPCGHTRGDAL